MIIELIQAEVFALLRESERNTGPLHASEIVIGRSTELTAASTCMKAVGISLTEHSSQG